MKTTIALKRISTLALVLVIAISVSVSAFAATGINSDRAEEIAYSDANVTADQVTSIDRLVLYRSGNEYFYKFVFRTASAKHVYIIKADTGDVVQGNSYRTYYGKGKGAGNGKENGICTGAGVGDGSCITTAMKDAITSEGAFAIVLKHSGLSESSLKEHEIELEKKRGVHYYKIELETKFDSEYEYKIDALTGEILDYEYDD